jgi:hypothetical protein
LGTFFVGVRLIRIEADMSGKKMSHQTAGQAIDGERRASDPNKIISLKLKALYNSVEEEGIPDRFLSLLEQLDEAERKQGKKGDGDA